MAGIDDDAMPSEARPPRPNYANTVAIGEYSDHGKVSILMQGKLEEYVAGLRRYVTRAEGVTEADIVMVGGKPTIIATCKLISDEDTPEQIRIRIRNRCRDWFHEVTGFLTNTGIDASYVDLIEDAKYAA